MTVWTGQMIQVGGFTAIGDIDDTSTTNVSLSPPLTINDDNGTPNVLRWDDGDTANGVTIVDVAIWNGSNSIQVSGVTYNVTGGMMGIELATGEIYVSPDFSGGQNAGLLAALQGGGTVERVNFDGVDPEWSFASGENYTIACFASGTLIETEGSETAVEALRPGMRVMTRDQDLMPVLWVGSTQIDAATLQDQPKLRPVLIRRDALAPGVPRRDLWVSPQHRVLLSSDIARRMFGGAILVPAIKLTGFAGIDVDETVQTVRYHHIACASHALIGSNGAWTESFYPGHEAILGLDTLAKLELAFKLPSWAYGARPALARPCPIGPKRKSLIDRHLRNPHHWLCDDAPLPVAPIARPPPEDRQALRYRT